MLYHSNKTMGTAASSSKHGFGACGRWVYATGIVAFVFVLAGVLSGFLVPMYVNDQLEAILVCDKRSIGYDGFENARDAKTHTYELNLLYNITNSAAFVNGEEGAVVVESQPYIYQKLSRKFDVEFGSLDEEGYETVKYKTWDQYVFQQDMSCSGCAENDEFFTMSIPYSGILTAGLSEAMIVLEATCTTTQIANIFNSSKSPCAPVDFGTDADCACCQADSTCVALLQPDLGANPVSALLSYLGRMDRGVKVREGTTAMGDSGVFSPAIVRRSVREIMLGQASAIGGYGAVSAAASASDVTTVDIFTTDYATACESVCPLADPSSVLNSCDGIYLPDTNDELATAMGISDDEVQHYSYLRKMSCAAYPWVALARVLANPLAGGSDAECVDTTKTAGSQYCCLWKGSSPNAPSLKGFGCVIEVGGGLNERLLDTLDEAKTLKDGTDLYVEQIRTGCGNKMNSRSRKDRETQTIVMYKEETENPVWTKLPPVISGIIQPVDVQQALALDGFTTVLPLEGAYGTGVYPRGLSADYFSMDVSDGKPLSKTFKVFPVTTRRGLNFKFDKTVSVNGIKGAKFKFDVSQLDATASNQALGQGEPYKGIIAGYFYYQSSTVVSEPNFAYGDHYLLTQNDNSFHESADTDGVTISQTVDNYLDYTALPSPRNITSAMLTSYEEDESLLAYVVVEPSSGRYIEGHNRISSSFSVWECDPRQATNAYQVAACNAPGNSGRCYSTTMGIPYPCSAANVLTPQMHGGKIIPVAYNDEYATISNDDANTLTYAGTTVFFARVFMVVLCGLGVILAGVSYYLYTIAPKQASTDNSKRKSADVSVPSELAKIYGTDEDAL